MQKIMSNLNLEVIFILNIALFLITLLFISLNRISISKMKKRYHNLINNTNNENIGDQLVKNYQLADEIKKDNKLLNEKLLQIENVVNMTVKKVGIVRYNAFKDVGSDLSFSIAILNDYDDGIVFTGLYSRDNSTTYAKPIKNNASDYTLSEEEKKAIKIAKENYLAGITK